MTECPPPEQLPTWFGLPNDDSRRQHVDECPRCRSWWLEYQAFEKGATEPRSEETDKAVRRLVLPKGGRRNRAIPRRRWLIAASIPLLAGGLWWASSVRAPTAVQWRGEPSVRVTTPFEVDYEGTTLRLGNVPPEVAEVHFLWLGADLGVIRDRTWKRGSDFSGATLETEVGAPPDGAWFWQIEWSLVDGESESSALVRVSRE